MGRRKGVLNFIIIAFTIGILLASPATAAFAFGNGQAAGKVIGQVAFNTNDSTTAASNKLNTPVGVAFDQSGNVWVADAENNRVLRYQSNHGTGTNANLVLGQPDFTQNTVNNGGLSSSSLFSPQGVRVDGLGNVWVVDTGNNRVLMFNDGDNNPGTSNFVNGQVATKVLGQPDFVSNLPNQGGAISASTLEHPRGITFDALGRLVVSDSGNNRVLQYTDGDNTSGTSNFANGQAASVVFGQINFALGLANKGAGPTGTSLWNPNGVVFSPLGHLYVADVNNHRVLQYSDGDNLPGTNAYFSGQSALIALGQVNLVSNARNQFTVTASTLNYPQSVAFLFGNLYVADAANNRVLVYVNEPFVNGEAAVVVLGHSMFTTGDPNDMATVDQRSLFGPSGVAFNGLTLYVSDTNNNRVLTHTTFPATNQLATFVLGQANFFTNTASDGGLDAARLSIPRGARFDALGQLWVSDSGNNRVLMYNDGDFNPNTNNFVNGQAASLVLGQANAFLNSPNRGVGVSSLSLNNPQGVYIDSLGNVWVADTANNRVLKYTDGDALPGTSNFATGQAAFRVIGQPTMITNLPLTGSGLNSPSDVVLDSTGNLIISDSGNNRVKLYNDGDALPNTSNFGNGHAVSVVVGTGAAGVSANTFNNPEGLAVDGSDNVWVGDSGNNRILLHSAPLSNAQPATTVLGQPGASLTSNTANNGGLSASTLKSPRYVALDTSGNLFASDAANHRVLQYTSPISSSQAALIVIGQSDFTTNTPNTGGISARTLNIPLGVIVDAIGNLWIADGANHRVLGHADLTDTDLDGIADVDDNCINTPNPNQLDMDGDGVGDLCDVVNIITSDVTLSVNTISLGNVIVQNNAVLTIEGITLDINFGTFSLTVKSGGGVLIKSGGTIT